MIEAQKIIAFYRIVEKLALIKRDIKLSDGRYESDSAHILKVVWLAKMVSPYLQKKADLTRMLELALVHDLVEAECGDVPLCGQQGNPQLKMQKQQNELSAIKRYRELLPKSAGEKIYDLFMEYEHKSSREAKIVYVLDKIEANFQACRFGDVNYWGEGDNGNWYYSCVLSGETPEKAILAELDEPLLVHLENHGLYCCRQAIFNSGIQLDTTIPGLDYQSLPLTDMIVKFMDIVEKLALTPRDNLLSDGTQETDADHIIKLCYLLLILTPYLEQPFDYTRTFELALVHDLPEALSGDISLSAQIKHPELKRLKHEKELTAINTIRNLLPPPLNHKIYQLFSEYKDRATREAKIIKLLDKLEGTLQSNLYHDGDVRYWRKCDGGDWYYSNAVTPRPLTAELNEPALTALQQEIIDLSTCNILKCGLRLPETKVAAQ